MSDTVTFNAESRAQVGKGAARAIRRNGRVPAVVYGANKDPEAISIDPGQLRAARMQPGFFATLFDVEIDGKSQQVLCRDLQLHPVNDRLSSNKATFFILFAPEELYYSKDAHSEITVKSCRIINCIIIKKE
jgi:ribosomal protein L25 (general stress protein Ctc)